MSDQRQTSTPEKHTTTPSDQPPAPARMRWPNVQSQTRPARSAAAAPPPPAYTTNSAGTHNPDHPRTPAPYTPATVPSSRLLLLPNEILLEIASSLPTRTLFHLHLCSHRLHTLLHHRLIAHIPHHAHHVMTWSIARCSPPHFTHALAAAAPFTTADMSHIITHNHAPLLPALFAARPGYRRAIAPAAPPPPTRRMHSPPLHHAVREGAVECVRVLLQEGACPDLLDKEGHRPLWYALRERRGEEVRALVAAGAGRVLGCGGADAVRYAVQERPEMVAILVEGWGAGGVAHGGARCCRSTDEVVKVGGVRETVVPTGGVPARVRRGGERSLQMAVRDGRLDVVRELLAAGADVNELGDGRKTVGWAPLHESVCKKGREQIMELLLESGARVDILGLVSTDATLRARALPGAGKGLTPLQLAKRLKNRQAVAMLEAYGARE